MLTQEAGKALDQEREKTGESMTAIVNRAILQLGHPETAESSGLGTRQPERDDIMAKILIMTMQGLNQSQIARALNDKGVQTFTGRGKWYPGTIRNLFQGMRKEGKLSNDIKDRIFNMLNGR